MDEMISFLKQDLDNLKFLVRVKGQTYRITEANRLAIIIEKLEKRNVITKRVTQALSAEAGRMEILSTYLHIKGKESRSLCRKREARRLRTIVKLIQKKT